jgi:hypothetical protein
MAGTISMSTFFMDSAPQQDVTIDIKPIDRRIYQAVNFEKDPDGGIINQLFKFNHIDSIRTALRQTSTARNQFATLNEHLMDGSINQVVSNAGNASNSVVMAMERQLETNVKNIVQSDILYKATTRLLKKTFSLAFAPARTKRHLAYLKLPRKEKVQSAAQKRKSIRSKIDNKLNRVARLEIRKKAESDADVQNYLEAKIKSLCQHVAVRLGFC